MTEISRIEVHDFRTGEVIGRLSKEDVDEQFLIELQHDNIERVVKDSSALMYKTKESMGSYCVMKKGQRAKLGNLGTFTISPDEAEQYGKGWLMIAVQYAVGMGAEYNSQKGLYVEPFSRGCWKVVESADEAERTVTLSIGEQCKTFHFRREWKEMER